MGFFLVLVLEQAVLAFKDPSPPLVEECRALLVDSGIQTNDMNVRLRSQRRGASQEFDGGNFHLDSGSRSALRVFILVFSLSLHSVFEGLAVGLLDNGKAVLETCLALILHQSLVSFSLAFKLSQGRLRRAAVAGCLLLFAAMSPIGVGVGVALGESRAPPQHRLARCTLEGLAAGTFVYITFMEILPRELGSGGNRIPKVAMLLAGFAVVTGVLFIKL
ncbi:zinc transporter ZIP1-like [Etheostoma cragini]|uniref:zinc transporter ZIP1-like n=1 Tax=Etheostoma cragini TaxID=417921 RepID=UPI00155F16A9|nr:zinc transporter ZIP1-like [Etheostoma cragini]